MNRIALILDYILPGAQFSMRGTPQTATEYDQQVTWMDSRPQPTWTDVQQAATPYDQHIARNEIEAARAAAYRQESDPLFFEWQRGEGTEQAWRDKVEEIRQRYPYPS